MNRLSICIIGCLLTVISVTADSYTDIESTKLTRSGVTETAFYIPGYQYASPALGDMDGDGDLDLVVGSDTAWLTLYRNDGSVAALSWGAAKWDGFQLNGESRLVPCWGDLDDDGDMDLLVGTASGDVFFVENTGTSGGFPTFSLDTTPIATAGQYSKPALDDIDNDGDLDLLVGYSGKVSLFRNIGTAAAFDFSLEADTVVDTTSVYGLSPAFTDMDGDGDNEMVCGTSTGKLALYEKQVDGNNITYVYDNGNYGGINHYELSTCTFGDLDNDGDDDLVVSDVSGELRRYVTTMGAAPGYTLAAHPFAGLDMTFTTCYTVADFSGDGVPDLLMAVGKNIAYLVNSGGTPDNPEWTLVSAAITTTTYQNLAMDTWDYDLDGDLDVFFGNNTGGIGLLRNTGTPGSPAFTEVYTGYGASSYGNFDNLKIQFPNSCPRFVDVDGDGDRDVVIMNGSGNSAMYRNDDIDLNQGGADDLLDGWEEGDFTMVKSGGSISTNYFPFGGGTNSYLTDTDLDGDQDPDFLFGNWNGTLILGRNTGSPTAASFTMETVSYAGIQFNPHRTSGNIDSTVEAIDMNGDGWTDLVMGGRDGGLRILLNDAAPDTTAPSAPTGFTATAVRHDRVKLSWNPVTESNGTGIGQYIIKRDGQTVHTLDVPTPFAMLDTGLSQTTTYNYEIIAVDRAGNPSTAATASATTGLPPELDHFEFVEPAGLEDATFDLTIRAIDNYGFVFDSFAGTVDLVPSSGTINPTSVTLTNGETEVSITYSETSPTGEILLTITASSGGVSNDTGEIHLDIITPDTPNLSNAILLEDPIGVQLTWNSVFDYGGSAVYYVDVYRNGSRIQTVNGTLIAWTDYTVQPETTYTYKLKSRDEVGNTSVFSNEMEVTTPAPANDETPPSIPENLRTSFVGTDSVALRWDVSTDTGGSGMMGYEVFRGPTMLTMTPNNYYTALDLSPNTTYTFFVRAVDNAGNRSNFSDGLTVTTDDNGTGDITPPSTPTNLTADATGDTTVVLDWDASTDNLGGSGVGSYRVYRNDYAGYTSPIATVAASQTSWTDISCTAGTTYMYKLRAVDNAGNVSGFTDDVTVTTPDSSDDTTPPTTPANLTGTADSAQQIDLDWDPSTDDVAMKEYIVFQNVRAGFGVNHYELKRVAASITATSIIQDHNGEGLAPNTEYTFSVQAVDTSDNKSGYSAAVTVTTPDVANDTTPPDSPTGLALNEVRSTHVTLSYNAAADNPGGSGVSHYGIYRNDVLLGTTSDLTYQDTNVAVGETYTYHVTAVDYADNESDPSDPVTTQIPDEDMVSPTTPSDFTAEATPDEVQLSWNLSYDEGSGVNYYEIYKTILNTPFSAKSTKATPTFTTPFTSYTDTDVDPGVEYQYRLRAVDRAGNGSSYTYLYVTVPDVDDTDHTIYFPHLHSDSFWWTGFALVNTSGEPAAISFEFYSSTGELIATLDDHTTLAAGEKLVSTILDLFDGEVPENAAWWRVTSDKRIDGFELFGTLDSEEMVGVKISKSSAAQLFFPSVIVDDTYWTGIAVINLGETDATVTFTAFDADGNELGTSESRSIPSYGKLVDVAENFFAGDTLPEGTVTMKAASEQPCIGFELFGYKTHEGLAGLSATPLDPESAFKSVNGKAMLADKGADAPQNLAVSVLSSTEVELSWEPPITGTPDTYRIYTAKVQHTPFGPQVTLQELMVETTETTYILGELTPATEYTFVAIAVEDDVESGISNDVTVTTDASTTEELFMYVAPRIEELHDGNTTIEMVNMSEESATLTITTVDGDGNDVETDDMVIPGRGKRSISLGDTFTIQPDLTAVRVVSDQPLTVYEVFEHPESGYYDTLYAFSTGMEKFYFTHIAPETFYWNTDIAIWNLAEFSNRVTLKLYRNDGSLLETTTVTIPALGVSTGEIHDFIPDDDTVQQIGWIEVIGQYPVNGYLAFGPKNGKTLSAIEVE